jgi:hypothetical protein
MDEWIVSHAFLSLQPIILSADSSSTAAAAEKKNNEKKCVHFISLRECWAKYHCKEH